MNMIQKYEMLKRKGEYLFSLTREAGEDTPIYTIESRISPDIEPDKIHLFPREMKALLKIINENDLGSIIEEDFKEYELPYRPNLEEEF